MEAQPTDLERSILRTGAWFSLSSHPATAFELWKWLVDPARAYGLGEVYAALGKSEWLQARLEEHEGMYALRGSSSIVESIHLRRERFADAQRKFRAVKRAAWWFQLLPGVRAVGAVNTLAWWATTGESDIDLYVITRPGYIWSSRFWLVLPFALLGRRPHVDRPRPDPFCFSFFTSHDSLQLEPLCLPRDIYMSFWVKSIVPVIDRDGWFDELHRLNRWASKQLPNARARTPHHRHRPARLPAFPIQQRYLEPLFRHLQRTRLPATLRELANLDTRVIVRDDMLKFHNTDRRAQYRDSYEDIVARNGCG